MPSIVIRDQKTNEIVHEIDVTGRTESEINRIQLGLSLNFDFERFMFGVEE